MPTVSSTSDNAANPIQERRADEVIVLDMDLAMVRNHALVRSFLDSSDPTMFERRGEPLAPAQPIRVE